jgi:hypothetical protein
MKLVKVGDIDVPDPEQPVASEWGIVGDINNWGNTGVTDVVMYS